jgi:hypothetical protein
MKKVNVKGLAIALGATWAICMLFAGWASTFGWCTKFVEVMGSIYIGFKPTFWGAIIGAIWGFFDAGIGGLIIAVIYNAVAKKK